MLYWKSCLVFQKVTVGKHRGILRSHLFLRTRPRQPIWGLEPHITNNGTCGAGLVACPESSVPTPMSLVLSRNGKNGSASTFRRLRRQKPLFLRFRVGNMNEKSRGNIKLISEGTCSRTSWKGDTSHCGLAHRAAERTALSGGESPKKGENLAHASAWQTFSQSKDGNTYIENPEWGVRGVGATTRDWPPRVTVAGLPSRLTPLLGWNPWKHIEVNNSEWGETALNITGLFSLWFTRLFSGQVKASSVAAATKVGCVTRSSYWREKRGHFLSLVEQRKQGRI